MTWHVVETQVNAKGESVVNQDIPNYAFNERNTPPKEWRVLIDTPTYAIWIRVQDKWWPWRIEPPAIAIMTFTLET